MISFNESWAVCYTPEPFIGCANETGQMPLDIFDIVQLAGHRILNVNDDDLPVRFTLVEKSHDSENLYLLDLSNISNLFADFANVKGVVVTFSLRFGMHLIGIFPRLQYSHEINSRA